jgi:hypothetical protein
MNKRYIGTIGEYVSCEYLKDHDYSWDSIDKLCQWADIPFIVKEWTRIQELNNT